MWFFKKKEDFLEYTKKLREFLEKGKYDAALARYTKLKYLFNRLPKDKKEKYESEFNSLSSQLMIYTNIEELNLIINKEDLSTIQESLSHLNYLIKSTDNISENYLSFINLRYNEYLREFTYRTLLRELQENLDEIYKLKDEGSFDLALEKFPSVIRIYKELEGYSLKPQELLEKLIKLREELKMNVLKVRAYSPVAKVDVKTLKKALRKKDIEKARELHNQLFK